MTSHASLLAVSDTDSRRFGLKIVRGNIPAGAPSDAVWNAITSLRPDVTIFRCEAGDCNQARDLIRHGLTPIHADTLVYYDCDLRRRSPDATSGGDVSIREAGTIDTEALTDIVRRSFAGYRNHYHANPLFDRGSILEGYVEWALAFATGARPDRQTWTILCEGSTAGFATCRIDAADSDVEIVLNAVDPTHARKGLYTKLLAFLLDHYGRSGVATLSVSTQVWNYAVQRVWCRSGLTISRALDTYHVNALLGSKERT